MKNIKFFKLVKNSFITVIDLFMADAGMVGNFEFKVNKTNMAKPAGFPRSALTMIVTYEITGFYRALSYLLKS